METVLIVGSGLAALTAAERLSVNKQVTIITKSTWNRSNSLKAQGGVAASLAKTDHWQQHYEDTMIAGCYLNNKKAVELLVRRGPGYIQELVDSGVAFDRNEKGDLLLGKEGAHSNRRILHAGGDATGKIMMNFMRERLLKNASVTFIENESVVDLIVENNRCIGLIAGDMQGALIAYYANHVILATGGCGGLYEVTSNDPTVVGDGIAIAYRAGAELSDLEFIQFHPTMLYVGNKCYGLVSEAIRGEGAFLVSENGKRIMRGIHPLEDLAPRDIVARAIHTQRNLGNRVFLNISDVKHFETKFPTVTSLCEKANIRVKDNCLPVAPGAHFMMGGIKTNHLGKTSVDGLYAIGEVACTEVHGANRLASNSLLEGIVFANLLADSLLDQQDQPVRKNKEVLRDHRHKNELKVRLPQTQQLRKQMEELAGIERSETGLTHMKDWLESYQWQHMGKEISRKLTTKEWEHINRLTACWLIVTSALQREESRGGHYRLDYPARRSHWDERHIIRKKAQLIGVGK